MDLAYWLDERHFSAPEDYENSAEYSTALYNDVINRYGKEHGGTPKILLKKTAKAYTELYAYAKHKDKLILTRSDLEYFADNPFGDGASEAVNQNGADRLGNQLSYSGWLSVDPDYSFGEFDWTDEDSVYVYQQDRRDEGPPIIPDIQTILDTLESPTLVATAVLTDYVEKRLHQLPVIDSVTDKRIAAYTTAIETTLADRNWIPIDAMDTSLRLWVNPERAHTELLERFSDEVAISKENLTQELYTLVHDHTKDLEESLTLDLGLLVEAFYQRLRSDDWGEIKYEDSSTWYRTTDAHRKALKEMVDELGDILEDPFKTAPEEDATRQKVYDFFDKNRIAVTRHGFYENGFLMEQLAKLDWFSEADETWKKMDGAETAGGIWELPFEFESERDEEAVADGGEEADDKRNADGDL